MTSLTHVGFVFWHGSHGVLMRGKLYIRLARHSPVRADLQVNAHRVQRREELKIIRLKRLTNINIWTKQRECFFHTDLRCICRFRWLCMEDLSCGHSDPSCSERTSLRLRIGHLREKQGKQSFRLIRFAYFNRKQFYLQDEVNVHDEDSTIQRFIYTGTMSSQYCLSCALFKSSFVLKTFTEQDKGHCIKDKKIFGSTWFEPTTF